MNWKRRTIVFVALFGLFQSISSVLTGIRPIVYSSVNPAEYHLNFWVGGLRIWVQYPEECHNGDSISYDVLVYSSEYSAGNYIDEIRVTISVPLTRIEVVILSDALICEDMLMPHGDEYSQRITVVVPNKAFWYVTITFHVSTFSGDMAEHVSTNVRLGSTIVRNKTYGELQSESHILWYNFTSLRIEHDGYKATHSHSNNQYNSLNSSYNSLKSSYDSLQRDYNDLKSTYQTVGEPVTIRNLMYIFIITTIVFICTTAYVALRKPRVASSF